MKLLYLLMNLPCTDLARYCKPQFNINDEWSPVAGLFRGHIHTASPSFFFPVEWVRVLRTILQQHCGIYW